MGIINEIRFKLELLWIDHPHKIMFGLGLIVGLLYMKWNKLYNYPPCTRSTTDGSKTL